MKMEFLKTYEEFNFKNFDHLFKKRAYTLGSKYDTIYLSNNILNAMQNIDNNSIASLFISLKNISKDKLVDGYANYLDLDEKGTVSYLDGRYLKEETEYKGAFFTDQRRQNIKVTKVLAKILKPEYLPTNQVDVERFANAWKVIFDNRFRVEEMIGEELLRAYNYKDEVKNSGGSCALFPNCGSVGRFDVLVKNPDIFSAMVVFDGPDIVGRRIAVKGTQIKDHGYFKEGQYYKFLNNYYGQGGSGSAVDQMISKFAKNVEFDAGWGYGLYSYKDEKKLDSAKDIFRIKLPNFKQKDRYPSFDIFRVNFQLEEIASSKPLGEVGWQDFYGAYSPQ